MNGDCCKQAVLLFGSPHPAGHTALMTDAFLSGLDGYSVARFDAYSVRALPCMACGVCETEMRCAYRDLDPFYHALEQADMLILATPVYHDGLPAPLKAMIDRLQVYWSRRFKKGMCPPIEKAKAGVVLLTAGESGERGQETVQGVRRAIDRTFTILHTKETAFFAMTGTDRSGIDVQIKDRLKNLAKSLAP